MYAFYFRIFPSRGLFSLFKYLRQKSMVTLTLPTYLFLFFRERKNNFHKPKQKHIKIPKPPKKNPKKPTKFKTFIKVKESKFLLNSNGGKGIKISGKHKCPLGRQKNNIPNGTTPHYQSIQSQLSCCGKDKVNIIVYERRFYRS